MNPLEIVLGVVSGLTSLGGLLGGQAAAKRAKAARDAALAEISRQLDQEYQLTVDNNRRNLLSATGVGGDAIRALFFKIQGLSTLCQTIEEGQLLRQSDCTEPGSLGRGRAEITEEH